MGFIEQVTDLKIVTVTTPRVYLQWVIESSFDLSQKESVFSTKCPKHQTILIK